MLYFSYDVYFCFVLKGFFFLLFPPLEDLFVTTNLHIDTESKFDFVLLGGFPHLKIRLIITFFHFLHSVWEGSDA